MSPATLLVTLVLLVPPPPAPAAGPAGDDEAPGWQHVLPGTTVVFLGTESVAELKRDWKASPYGRLLADAELKPLATALQQSFDGWSEESVEELGVDLLGWKDMAEGPLALAVLDVSGAPGYETGRFPLMGALLADVSGHREEAIDLLEASLDAMAEHEDVIVVTDEVDDELFTTVLLGDGSEHGDAWITWAFHGDVLVAGAGAQGLESEFLTLWTALDGGAETVLAETPLYEAVPEGWDGDGVLLLGDLGALMGMVGDGRFGPDSGPGGDEREVFERLGLFHLGALAQAVTIGAGGTRSDFALRWGGDGLLFDLVTASAGEAPPRLLDLVPTDSLTAMAVSLDPVGIFDEVVRMVIETSSREPADVVAGLAEMDATLGFSLRDDLLANLDGQLALVSAKVAPAEALPGQPPGTDPMNYALALGLSDGDAIRALVDRVVGESPMRAALRREEFLGFDFHRLPVGLPGLQLNWVVADDVAVLSLAPTLVQDVVRRKTTPDLPSIGRDEAFRAELARHPSGPMMLNWGDSAANVLGFFSGFRAGFALTGGQGRDLAEASPIVRYLLENDPPKRETIQKYFDRPGVTTLVVDAGGLLGVTTAP